MFGHSATMKFDDTLILFPRHIKRRDSEKVPA